MKVIIEIEAPGKYLPDSIGNFFKELSEELTPGNHPEGWKVTWRAVREDANLDELLRPKVV